MSVYQDEWRLGATEQTDSDVSSRDNAMDRRAALRTLRREMLDEQPEFDSGQGVADHSKVAGIVEKEIIPRLFLSHSAHAAAQRPESGANNAPASRAAVACKVSKPFDIRSFGLMVVRQPLRVPLDEVEKLLKQGVSREEVLLRLLSPTASWLGDMWLEDKLGFIDVTLGMANLQQMIRLIGMDEGLTPLWGEDHGRMLLAAVPGEEHSFGLSIVEELIRLEGWDTQYEIFAKRDVLLSRTSTEWFDVIGLSASIDRSVAQLPQLIAEMRETGLNANVTIVVGGAAFACGEVSAGDVGADRVARDARDALTLIRSLTAQHTP